ncbi:MAG: hypothetical protein U0237_01265 [Thermoleophilia bacterium]
MDRDPIFVGRLALATALAGRLLPDEPVLGACMTVVRPLGRRQVITTPTVVVATDRRLLMVAARNRVAMSAMTAPDSWAPWTDGDPEFMGGRGEPLTRWPGDDRFARRRSLMFVHAPPAWFGTIEDLTATAARPVTVPGVLPEGSAQTRIRLTRTAPEPGLDIAGYDEEMRVAVIGPLTAGLAGPNRHALPPRAAPAVVREPPERLTLRRVGALLRPASREDSRAAHDDAERAVADVLARLPGAPPA